MKFIFRDDDISYKTDVRVVKYIHEQFLKHHLVHTASFLCEHLEQNTKVIDYINSTTNWNLCIHGWTHKNYCLLKKNEIGEELDKCILKMEEVFDKTPEKWFLPYNGWTDHSYDKVPFVADIAFYHGVDVDTDWEDISAFVADLACGRSPFSHTVQFSCENLKDLRLLPELFFLAKNFQKGHSINLQDLL